MKCKLRLLLVALIFSMFTIPMSTQAQECAAGTRAIDDAFGTVCIPEHPMRIVSMDVNIMEFMVLQGVKPVIKSDAAIQYIWGAMFPEFKEQFEQVHADVPDVGFPPNAEVIVGVQPDLIIATKDLFTEELYAQFSQLAPTVAFDLEPGDWRGRVELAGELLNMQDAAAQRIKEVDYRLVDLKDALSERGDLSEIEISLVRILPGQVGVMIGGSTSDRLIREIGFSRPEAQNLDLAFTLGKNDGRPELAISDETLTIAEGDYAYVFGDTTELKQNPLWSALAVVKEGRAFDVGYYWYGDGLLAVHFMIDDLFKTLADREPEVENPFKDGISQVEATATPAS